ncbi:MAG: hypothetical protein A2X49_10575 [Lentisphaerae bacterium GWF2_52_8]|nr:MAG: hypothetical protein A2X49_10575 [Lentisphaerae bacterium GWF2_52_8]
MSSEIKVAILGLDTSHSVEFPKRMQAPDCPPEQKISGMRAISCMRFETPFQNREGLDARQKQLEAWGVMVSESFEETVKGCDAVMIEINDPSLHLEYFRRCVGLGKKIFVDKPFADNSANALEMRRIASDKGLSVMSCSPLRFGKGLEEACAVVSKPSHCSFYGPLGKAPAGSSIVWYGVHACEMLQRAMGPGALGVKTLPDSSGVVLIVDYKDGRRGVVELVEKAWHYGGTLRGEAQIAFPEDTSSIYQRTLFQVEKFFRSGTSSVSLNDACEVTGILDAAERSFKSGKRETVIS